MDAGTSCLKFSESLDKVTEQWTAIEANHLPIASDVGNATVPFDPVL